MKAAEQKAKQAEQKESDSLRSKNKRRVIFMGLNKSKQPIFHTFGHSGMKKK